MIKNKEEMLKCMGLVLMFMCGWIASDLVNQIGCKDCDYRQQGMVKRMERMEMGERMKNRVREATIV